MDFYEIEKQRKEEKNFFDQLDSTGQYYVRIFHKI